MIALGSKAVSKRNGHAFIEDDVSKDKDQVPKRMSQCEKSRSEKSRFEKSLPDKSLSEKSRREETTATTDTTTRRISTSTATSQSSSSSEGGSISNRMEISNEKTEVISLEMGKDVKDARETLNPLHMIPTGGRPVNFGVVVPGVYRSHYPQIEDYPFIEKLKLKTIVTLVQKDFPEGYKSFISTNGIKHYVFDMKGTKKEEIPVKTMKAILRIVLDQQNYPLLMHCNHGRHRTGCVVAIVRKVSGWDVDRVLDEYKSYAEPKVRDNDLKYITAFELSSLSNLFVRESSIQLRVRNFIRATCFTLFVLLVWLISGRKLAGDQRKIDN